MEINLQLATTVTYAGAQNFIPVVQQIKITNSDESAQNNLILRVTAEPELAKPLTLNIARIEAGSSYTLDDVNWPLNHDYLVHLQEAVRGQVTIQLIHQDMILATTSEPIEVLAYDEWSGFRQLPELLTAFAQPNSKSVSDIMRKASSKLLAEFNLSLSGYQTNDRGKVAQQIGAIYAAICDANLHYSNPPASFTGQGQKIRLPDRIIEEKLATCLDLAMLLISCLEQVGLNPIIILDQGHAWAGCWLVDQTLPHSSVDNQEAIRKRIDAGELLAIECTGMTLQSRMSFAQAVKRGGERLKEEHASQFDLAIDVSRARKGLKILPLALKQLFQSQSEDYPELTAETSIGEIELPMLGPDVVVNSTVGCVEERSRIDQWRDRLLDLTMRNKLINFKQTNQSIPLYYPDPEHIEDVLASGKGLKLKSLPDLLPKHDPRSGELQHRETHAELRDHASREALRRHELLADTTGVELDKRLTELFRSARTAQEEGGANTLFLVIGMLQRMDSKDAERKVLAPLVMVPVSLDRQSVNSGFSIKRHDDDTLVNPTLVQLLERQYELKIPGITGASELPMDESGVDIPKILASFRSSVVNLPGFEVLPEVWLGMFSFTKYLMWKDLTDRQEDILKSPLVRHLINADKDSTLANGNFIREDRLDEVKQPRDLFIPLDCDSSQLAAVNAAADGLSFVLEGPPGTGKSQTITNIVADAMARGKTVLFVSEKIAALTVVHDRLKKLGFEPFLLELHSAKASKSEVLGQFEKALKAGGKHTVADWELEATRLGRMRGGLNGYVRALHDRHQNGWSAYDATAQLVRHSNHKPCGLTWPNIDQHSIEQLDQVQEMVRQIGSIGELVSYADKQNLSFINKKWSPSWQASFIQACESFQQTLTQLSEQWNVVIERLALEGIHDSQNELSKVDSLCSTVLNLKSNDISILSKSDFWQPEVLAQSMQVFQNRMDQQTQQLSTAIAQLALTSPSGSQNAVVNGLSELNRLAQKTQPDYGYVLSDTNIRTIESMFASVIQNGKQLHALESGLRQTWSVDLLKQPASQLSMVWQESSGFWWFKKWMAQFRIRNALKSFHLEGKRPCTEQVSPLLELLTQTTHERENLTSNTLQAQSVLDQQWGETQAQVDQWREAQTRINTIEQTASQLRGVDQAKLKNAVLKGIQSAPQAFLASEEIGQQLTIYQQRYSNFCTSLIQVMDLAGTTAADVIRGDSTNALGDLRSIVRGWVDSSPSLRDWSRWLEVKQQSVQFGLGPLVRNLESGDVPWSEASNYFKSSYADWFLNQVMEQTDDLARFSALDHERKIVEFRQTDARFSNLTKQYIYARLAERIPMTEMPPPQTPLGILRREIQKKSRHMPVRKLLSSTSSILSHLAPCLLMSPLSVAQYLDTVDTRFDLVIFDEASQIPTWDAIGAIARGKQVIVVGDPKQLPPTSFFGGSGNDGEVAEGEIEDLESILDECLGSGMLTHTLKWHYRSQRESLIAFSNNRYYGSQLITFPSPVTPDNGVTYHPVVGTYQRSGARTNRAEAEAIISFIRKHYMAEGKNKSSVGVVTFSQAQQKLIEDLLDAARRQDVELDRRIAEHSQERLFVKNLENVQGDERDIILFSIGYGPDETGRVFMNFGPLNKEGGHRRLNVAITRAKEQVHIFATLHPSQMDISKTKATGVMDLKRYLEFAIKGAPALLAHAAPTGHLPDSPFEEEVLAFLESKGWLAHPQVGCSSYRIDLGVIDPRAPGRYLMAVECDGASYHSAATARDRDKLRQMILEKLGWKVYRIWSTEWWTNPIREKERLIAALEQALETEVIEHEPIVEVAEVLSPEEVLESSGRSVMYAGLAPSPDVRSLVTPYTSAVLPAGDGELFYEYAENAKIKQMVTSVITQEGPVSDSVIRKRISAAYGFGRMGNRIQSRLTTLLSTFRSSESSDGRRFYWPDSVQQNEWTTVRSVGERDIEEIPDHELANCAKLALQEMIAVDQDALIKRMGNLLGLLRVAKPTQDKLAMGLKFLLERGEVSEVAGIFKLV